MEKRTAFLPNGSKGSDARRFQLVKVSWPVKEPVFTLFPNLPRELRVLIWKFALPDPRIIFIHKLWEQDGYQKSYGIWDSYEVYQRDKNNFCPLKYFLVCREFHEVFEEHYKRLKFKDLSISHLNETHATFFTPKPYIYVKRDTLVINISYCCPKRGQFPLELLDASEIQNLALQCHNHCWTSMHRSDAPFPLKVQPYIVDNVRGFKGLRNLTIVLGYSWTEDLRGNLRESRLVNIDHSILEMATEDGKGHYIDRENMLRCFLDGSIDVKKQFQGLKEQKGTGTDLSKVTFNVALMASLEGTSLLPPRKSWVPLVPTVPKYYGVCYYTESLEEKELEELIGERSSHRLYFKDLICWAPCHFNGKLKLRDSTKKIK